VKRRPDRSKTRPRAATPAPALDAAPRLRWGARVVAAGCACGIVLAPRLFAGARDYPRVPVVPGWPALPVALEYGLVALLLLALGAVALAPRSTWPARAAVALVVLLALGDQSRWQPWLFEDAALLAVLAIAARRPEEALDAWRIIIAATYLWSGVQKLNVTFATQVFPWLVAPLTGTLAAGAARAVYVAGLAAALLEAAIGLALLVPRLRAVAVVGAIATHALVLATLGPLGHATNAVVWPWNVALALLVAIAFWPGRAPAATVGRWRAPVPAAAILVFGVLPALSFVGWWDSYLSSALYSGNVEIGVVALPDGLRGRLPAPAQPHVQRNAAGTDILDLWEWSMAELGAPAYPEERVYRGVARALCRRLDTPGDLVLVVFGRPAALTGARETSRADCAAFNGDAAGTNR
jgi:hypothetical protein